MCDNHFGNPLGQLDWRRRLTGLAKKRRRCILLDPDGFRTRNSEADEAAQAAQGPAAYQDGTATAAACVPAGEPVRAGGDPVPVASPKGDEQATAARPAVVARSASVTTRAAQAHSVQ